MKKPIRHLMIVIAALAILCGTAAATETDMDRLPSSMVFGCALCHLSDNPTDASLNDFGYDFQQIGRLWIPDLATQDSDEDGCTNGAELGDVDGNGVLDEGVTQESSNPGAEGDCSAASFTDEGTWGQLKAMFGNNR